MRFCDVRADPQAASHRYDRSDLAGLFYCGLMLLWAWTVALSGIVGISIGLPVPMDFSKVTIVIAWLICTNIGSFGIAGVMRSTPGRRLTVIRLGVFLYHVMLRCVFLLLFVKAKR